MRRAGLSLCALGVLLASTGSARADKEYKVRVVTEPEGAEIRVDDPDAEPVGTSPWNGTLPAGPYMLIIDLDGHLQLIEEIVVKKSRKRQTFELTLTKIAMAKIEVTGGDQVEGATVLLDGKEKGTVPTTLEVAEGPHELIVEKGGFKRFEKWIEVNGGEASSIEVELESIGGGASAKKDEPSEPAPPRVAPLVVAGAGVEVAWRRWDYANPRTVSARPFDANLVPLLRGALELYPLAGNRGQALRGLGLAGQFALGLPPAAETTTDATIDTSWSEAEVGAFYRYPASPSAGLRVDVGYRRTAFGFAEAGAFADEVPDVDYRSVRVGVAGDYRSGAWTGTAGFSYLSVLSAGAVADRFRDATTSGLMFEGGLWNRVMPSVRAGASLSYRRYAHDFTSMSGDPVEADGGTDIYFGVTFGAAYLY